MKKPVLRFLLLALIPFREPKSRPQGQKNENPTGIESYPEMQDDITDS